MKEAMWGVLIVMLGILGIVIIQLFQNITVTYDQTYYLLKETTEAAMYDSIDLSYYRTKGKIRIVEDKFVENLTRRFAESASLMREYNIVVHEVNEEPPLVSLSIGTYVMTLQGEKFNLGESIDAIIETKYPKDPNTPDPIPDPDPNPEPTPGNSCPICIPGEDINCNVRTECITGDLKFVDWEDVILSDYICEENANSATKVSRKAKYMSCNCGKWEPKEATVDSQDPEKKSDGVYYTWNFKKTGTLRSIDVTTRKNVSFGKCTTEISCADGEVTIMLNKSYTLTPVYTPPDAVNRDLTWTSSDKSKVTVQNSSLPIGSTGIDKATVTGIGVTDKAVEITATSSNGKSGKCKINVVKEGWECPTETIKIKEGDSGKLYLKDNYVLKGMKFSVSNSNIINNLNQTTGDIEIKNNSIIKDTKISYTVTPPSNSSGYSKLTCDLIIENSNIDDDNDNGSGAGACTPGDIYMTWNTNKVSLPTLCPQDFEAHTKCYNINGVEECYSTTEALSALGIMESKVYYCGKNGGYTYPQKYKYDYSELVRNIVFYGEKNISGSSYEIKFVKNFTYSYDFWSTDVAKYISGSAGVTKSYTLTGKLKSRDLPECKAKETNETISPFMLISGYKTEMLEGSGGVQFTVDKYPATAFAAGEWKSSDSKVLTVDKNGNVKAVGSGTATITYSAKLVFDNTKTVTATTPAINVYGECKSDGSSPSISLSSSTARIGENIVATLKPEFGGASTWTVSNESILELKSAGTLKSTATLKALEDGTVTIAATRAFDRCYRTATITIKTPTLQCPADYPFYYMTNGNKQYCRKATPTPATKCSQLSSHKYLGYSFLRGKNMCFTSQQAANGGMSPDVVEPSVCDPWNTGFYSGKCYKLAEKVYK